MDTQKTQYMAVCDEKYQLCKGKVGVLQAFDRDWSLSRNGIQLAFQGEETVKENALAETHTAHCRVKEQSGCSPVVQVVENLSAMQETQVRSLGQEDPLEEGMTNHTSILG